MRNETNSGVARRYYEEVLNKSTIGLLDEIAVTEYKENNLLPGQGEGRAMQQQLLRLLRGWVPVRRALSTRLLIQQIVRHNATVT